MIQIETIATPCPEHDDYVRSCEDGKMCHLLRWSSMISEVYGHRTFHLLAREQGVIRGVLPLTLVESRIFGRRLVSQAFSNYGGPLLSDASAQVPLLNQAIQLATQLKCRHLELRATGPLSSDFRTTHDKVCMHLPLHGDPEQSWREFRPEIRNRIRKATRSGLISVCGGEELVRDFYDVWTVRMHQLGTPCYSRRLFEGILDSFPECTRVILVKSGNLTVAAGLFYDFNGLAQCRWAGTRTAFNRLAPNVLLYWTAIRHYCLKGVQTFDFGRSTVDSAQYEFKRRWGAKAVELWYQFWVPRERSFEPVTPQNPKYRLSILLWKRLPLSVSRLVGPHVSRTLA